MKFIVFCFILFGLESALAANVAQDQDGTNMAGEQEKQQPITVCSWLTDFEEKMRNCVNVKQGESCNIGLIGESAPEDVRDIMKAFFTNMLASCGQDEVQSLSCMLDTTVHAKGEHCS